MFGHRVRKCSNYLLLTLDRELACQDETKNFQILRIHVQTVPGQRVRWVSFLPGQTLN